MALTWIILSLYYKYVIFPSINMTVLVEQSKEKNSDKGRKKEKTKICGFVLAFLSYGINGGLMGYERMFYWKQ